jgi:hypothetical protein
MSRLAESIKDDYIEKNALRVSQEARQYYDDWKAGRVYISPGAFRAMAGRFYELDGRSSVTGTELCEWGRLYAFFMLVRDGIENQSPADLAVEFCNRLVETTPPPVIDATSSVFS